MLLENWAVLPTRLPLVRRRCHACASERFRAGGKFRVNANHKLIDAWLLVLCAGCGDTAKLTLFERTNVRSVRPDLLDRLHANDLALTAELLQDPAVQRRNRIALDWDGAWRLDTGGSTRLPPHPHQEGIEVSVRFAARIPVRPVRLIAEGCGLSRAEVERLIAEGNLVSAARLGGRLSGDFTFLLKRGGEDAPTALSHGMITSNWRRNAVTWRGTTTMNIKKRIGIAIALAFAATTLAFGTAAALDQGPTFEILAGNVSNCP